MSLLFTVLLVAGGVMIGESLIALVRYWLARRRALRFLRHMESLVTHIESFNREVHQLTGDDTHEC